MNEQLETVEKNLAASVSAKKNFLRSRQPISLCSQFGLLLLLLPERYILLSALCRTIEAHFAYANLSFLLTRLAATNVCAVNFPQTLMSAR